MSLELAVLDTALLEELLGELLLHLLVLGLHELLPPFNDRLKLDAVDL